tara:strand:+ start:36 stop:308 length:273 start_codon:yes stop_codon:yes gene_type:complete
MKSQVLYKDKLPCSPLLHFTSDTEGLIEWTWRTSPPEAVYWKTYRAKKRDLRILSKVSPQQRTLLIDELYEDIIKNEYPKKLKQPKVRRL